MSQEFYTVGFVGKPGADLGVSMINQLLLPLKEEYVLARTAEEVAVAIETMVVRGAPAIGVTAAMGLALGIDGFARTVRGKTERTVLVKEWTSLKDRMARTRPTAVNLFWAIQRMNSFFESQLDNIAGDVSELGRKLYLEAQQICDEDVAMCRAIGKFGETLVPERAKILTHCNAGALATAGYGTALGVIRAAAEKKKDIHVYCDETRPYLQGARLTAWEMVKEGIPATLITDNMAAHMMKTQGINFVVVGADRIARNGDVANKIGTYGVAILSRYHKIPFYVAAPSSTFDLKIKDGSMIPIEERSRDEVVRVGQTTLAPSGVSVRHPGFDVTPAELVTGIITEKGVISPVTEENVCRLMS